MEAHSAVPAIPVAAHRAASAAGEAHEDRATTVMRLARAAALPAAVAASVFGLAFSNGTYGVTARDSVAVAVWGLLARAIGTGAMPLARAAVEARRPLVRALAIAPMPVLAAVVYMPSSRGGALTAVLAAVAFVAFTRRRARATVSLAVTGFGALLAVAILHGRHHIVD